MISVPDAAHLGWTSSCRCPGPATASARAATAAGRLVGFPVLRPVPARPRGHRGRAGGPGHRGDSGDRDRVRTVGGRRHLRRHGRGQLVVHEHGLHGHLAARHRHRRRDRDHRGRDEFRQRGGSVHLPGDAASVPGAGRPAMRYNPAGLIAVQVALIQLCAARADAVALLSLPAHYHTADVLLWWQLISGNNPSAGTPLSFAAAWHPWIQVVEPSTPQLSPLRPLPPDGPAAGTIAAGRTRAAFGWLRRTSPCGARSTSRRRWPGRRRGPVQRPRPTSSSTSPARSSR